jgi:hypothetical protein
LGRFGVAIGAGKDLTVFLAVLGDSECANASIHAGHSPEFDSGPGTNTAPPSCTTLSYLSPISLNVRPGRFKSVLYEHISQ